MKQTQKQQTKQHTIDRLFIPQRTQPVHIGHMSLLEAACQSAEEVIIGIGSANKHDEKNPYTAYERELMLRKSLEHAGISNYKIVYLPDFKSDKEWLDHAVKAGELDKNTKIVSGNDWVEKIFRNNGYQTIRPEELIEKPLINICATELRNMIADDDLLWKKYAAYGTLYYFERFGGRDRITRFYQTQELENAA